MSELSRREALQIFAGIPLLATGVSPAQVTQASVAARDAIARATFVPKFFTAAELETVKILSDLVIPRDARSGSATDAGVPEFMDFILNENTGMQVPFRGGLAWINTEARERFGKEFTGITEAQRKLILDDIAYPKKAKPEFGHGVSFFNRFRDLTASGFFSSKMGVEDLQYIGNQFVMDWQGCPPAALNKLGVSY